MLRTPPPPGAGAAGAVGEAGQQAGVERREEELLWSGRNCRREYQYSTSVIASDQSAQPGGRVSVTREQQQMTARSERDRTVPCLHRSLEGLAFYPPLNC